MRDYACMGQVPKHVGMFERWKVEEKSRSLAALGMTKGKFGEWARCIVPLRNEKARV